MNEKAKILFFCMIFVAKGALGQKTILGAPVFRGRYTMATPDTVRLCSMTLIQKGNQYFIGFPSKADTVRDKPILIYTPVIIPGNYYSQQLGFFCKKEIQVEKFMKIPFKFRLGSVQQCDKMEGKPNSRY